MQVVNYYINEQIKEELKNICDKYEFKYKELSDIKVVLCAKDTDKHWQEWIKLDLQKNEIQITGNTDQCNFWFYDTRKDMTPNRIINFVASLNNLFRKFDTSVQIKTLIDPEDWQEIANVNDAYKDNLYNIEFHDIAFGEDNYIYFSLEYGEYSLDGLFRIHDPANGSDMSLVSIDCSTADDRNFVNAHWEEIEEKLCEIANQRQEKIEKNEEESI